MNKEMANIAKQLVEQGWEDLGVDGSGHRRFKSPAGKEMSLASTPSDYRTTFNEIARLRREGATINGRGKIAKVFVPPKVVVPTKPPKTGSVRERVYTHLVTTEDAVWVEDIQAHFGMGRMVATHALGGLLHDKLTAVVEVGRGKTGRPKYRYKAAHLLTPAERLEAGRIEREVITPARDKYRETLLTNQQAREAAVPAPEAVEAPAPPPAPEPSPEPPPGIVVLPTLTIAPEPMNPTPVPPLVPESNGHVDEWWEGYPPAFWTGVSDALLGLASAAAALAKPK